MRLYTSRVQRTLITVISVILFSVQSPLFAGGEQEPDQDALQVFVSIAPQEFLLQRIGGERIAPSVLVQEGQDPHTFDPTPSTMVRLSEAELYFRIGMEFEDALLDRMRDTVPDLRIVDCRESITLREMTGHDHDDDQDEVHDKDLDEDHGDDHDEDLDDDYDGDHEEVHGADPHIWMSIRNAITIARTMYTALAEIDPEGEAVYRKNFDQLKEELTALDEELSRILQPLEGRKLFVFHPAFGYFADDYGLEQIAVEIGGNEPSARQLAAVIDEAKEHGARVIFVQPQFSQKSAQAVAEEIGGAVVPIDSLAGDYIGNMRRIAEAVEEALK